MTISEIYIQNVTSLFHQYKSIAEKSLLKVNDTDFYTIPSKNENSLAQLVAHMAGNMRSRWEGFPEADGEKPNRNRDQEFDDIQPTREELMLAWTQGWNLLFNALETTNPESYLLQPHNIRGQHHMVIEAIQRQVAHYAYHVGQIVQLCKRYAGSNWESLSIPKGGSQAFNDQLKK